MTMLSWSASGHFAREAKIGKRFTHDVKYRLFFPPSILKREQKQLESHSDIRITTFQKIPFSKLL
jgi:hypothetical protein